LSYFLDDDASQVRELKDKLEKLQSDFLSTQFSVQQENVESGQRFKRRGANIVGGEIELVASEVTHIEDASGYHMVVKAVNKFEVPA